MEASSAEAGRVTVRSATAEDAPFVAWLLLEASRSSLPHGFYDVLFDYPPEDELLAILLDLVLTNEPSFTRWDCFLIVESDGTPAAGCCGFACTEYTGEGLKRAVHNAVTKRGWSADKVEKMERVWEELLVLWPSLSGENDHWIVEYVATKPEFRKKGLCHRSLLEILQRGRQRGFKRAQVTPYVENAASIKAYEKIGFREYCKITSTIFDQHIPNTHGALHMRMQL